MQVLSVTVGGHVLAALCWLTVGGLLGVTLENMQGTAWAWKAASWFPGRLKTSSKPIAGCSLEACRAELGAEHYMYPPHWSVYGCRRDVLPPGAWFDTATDYGAPIAEGTVANSTGIPTAATGRGDSNTAQGGAAATTWPPRRGAELIGTSVTQAAIHAHQHPANCSAARFLVHVIHRAGIGSHLHIFGQMMGVAMRLGRVFITVYSPHATLWTDGPFCPPNSTIDECYFEPWSNCMLQHAGGDGGVMASITHTEGSNFSYHHFSGEARVVWLNASADQSHLQTIWVNFVAGVGHDWKQPPPPFQHLLQVAGMREDQMVAWWRAQAAAYMVRPNARTLAELSSRRAHLFQNRSIASGTISMHVRHGDKGQEVEVMPDAAYAAVLDEVYSIASAGGGPPQKQLFLSTEDPATVEYFGNLSGWQTSFTAVRRKPDSSKSTVQYAEEFGATEEFLNSLLNLQLALECDAWIGHMVSNWAWLIEELRATVRCKANGIYRDVQQPYPPQSLLVWAA